MANECEFTSSGFRSCNDGHNVEVRLAILEQQMAIMAEAMQDVKTSAKKMQEDVSQLVQMTAIGKAAWKSVVWLGALVAGSVTMLYFLSQLNVDWSSFHLLAKSPATNPPTLQPHP
jgi:hypothetical protein